MLAWKVVCHRCLTNPKARPDDGWCQDCHKQAVATMYANLEMPALRIGPPSYAMPRRDREWEVISKPRGGKLRIRLVTGNADHLIPLEMLINV